MPTMHTLEDYSDLIKNYIDMKKLGDFVSATDVTVSSVTYHTYWKVAPTSSNQVYGVAVHPTNGRLYRIYNNKGTYSVTAYDADNNTTTGDGITTKVAKTGTAQSNITNTIAASTTMDNAIGTLLNNDVTVNTTVQNLSTVISKNGAHNLLPFDLATLKAINTSGTWSGNSYTHSGITFTPVVDDKGNLLYVNVNGINSSSTITAAMVFWNSDIRPFYLQSNNYILTGTPSGGGHNTYNCYVKNGSNYEVDLGNGKEFTISSPSQGLAFVIGVGKGQTVNNIKYYPMIRLASDADPTYEPYAKTNQQLTKETTGLIDNTKANGCVNHLENKATGNANATVNADKTVSISNSSGQSYLLLNDSIYLEPGTYRLSGSNIDGVWLNLYDVTNSTQIGNANTTDLVFTVTSASTRYRVRCYFVNVTATAKPMISLASMNLSYNDYVPYAKSNKELTKDVADIPYVALTDNGSSQYTLADGKIWQTKGVTFIYVAITCNSVSSIAGGNHIKVAQIPNNFKKPQFIMYPTIANVKDGSTHIGAQFQIHTSGQLAIRGGETGGTYTGLFSY